MAVDNIARGLAASALKKGGITPEQLEEGLAKKLDKAGGTVTGSLAIQGDLTVAGTTKSEKTKTLMVEDNVIVTNANKVALQALLSGIAINKDANATYGIMYDPADDTVKFGQGTLDKGGKFTFNASEGQPLAIRAQAAGFTEAHLVKWNATKNMFEDAGKSVDDIKSDVFSALTEGDNISIVKAADSEKVTISATGLVKQLSATNAIYTKNANGDDALKYFKINPTPYAIPMYNTDGQLQTNDPIEPLDAVNKQYFEANGLVCTNLSMNQNITITYLKSLTPGVYYKSIDYKFTGFDYNPTENYGHLIWFGNDKALFYPAFSDGFYILRSKTEGEGGGFTWIKLATTSDISLINQNLEGKVNVLAQSVVNEVYARTEAGVDGGIAYSYAAEGDTIAKRSAAGTLAVADPTQDGDAVNKLYVDRALSKTTFKVSTSLIG